ncbi:MAG: ATP-dependent helicase [Clostridia bacterium]|nr:ATP-dependent helicase [Clostridia bacterium]
MPLSEKDLLTYEEFTEKLGFIPGEQKEAAIKATEGQTLLLAVPGSGKTTALVARIGYMVRCLGIDPESILTVTYTVAAAGDMKARYLSLFGDEGPQPEFRTINGICASVISYYSRTTGRTAFRLCDDERTSSAMISAIFRELTGEYAAENDIREIKTAITYVKNTMMPDEDIEKIDGIAMGKFPGIYREYRRRMNEASLMDYDDQMVYSLAIFRKYPDILERFRKKYRFICVDEAQDTSLIQHRIIKELAGPDGNLFMVGDEDQSIYGFRAACPEELTGFEKNYPGGRVLLMEDNYRSAEEIVASADGFIRSNKQRHPKTMRAAAGTGGSITEVKVASRADQYTELLRAAKNCRVKTAVLYRDNESSLPLVDLLTRQGVDFDLRASDFVFFQSRVVRDIVSVLKLAIDGRDREAYMNVYNKISPFLSKALAEKAVAMSEAEGTDIYDAVCRLDELGKDRLSYASISRKALKLMARSAPDAAIGAIMNGLGYAGFLERSKIFSAKPGILSALAKNERTVGAFLWRLTELERIVAERAAEPPRGLFTLSTVHMAKGLEYDCVWLMDMTDDITPGHAVLRDYLQNPKSFATYEEERRIFYVAVTRAKKSLKIFRIKGSDARFAAELIDCRDRFRKALAEAIRLGQAPAIPGKTVGGASVKLGARVRHPRIGEGTVTGRTDKRVTVAYDCGELREYIASAVTFELI